MSVDKKLKMKPILILAILFIFPFYSFSQSKTELEERVEKKDVPLAAQQFIDSLHFSSKIKWFVEQDHEKKTFEAKTKSKGKKYSIEFDSLGNIEDIEIEMKWKKIPLTTQNAICSILKTDFDKVKINKIQIQYSGNSIDLIHFRKNKKNLVISYEIVLKGQKSSQTSFYEYLFSEKGELEKKILLDFRNTDHLEY